ncbi:MAG: hypothetical protein M1829_001854 [Trizodia sp. TS-e1964]|nr:MAG: hypothetical protein M1829_001854 [Trizodia sp. TS-e1964]
MTTKTLGRKHARWWEQLAAFDLRITYRKGKLNPADGLSGRTEYQDGHRSNHQQFTMTPLQARLTQDLVPLELNAVLSSDFPDTNVQDTANSRRNEILEEAESDSPLSDTPLSLLDEILLAQAQDP